MAMWSDEKSKMGGMDVFAGMNLDVRAMIGACKKTVYAYARVSTDVQDCQRQYEAFEEVGIDRGHTYTDKVSGKDFERPAFRELMEKVQPGDLIVCKSLDRFGRNVREIDRQIYDITCEKKVGIAFIDSPMLNRTSDQSTLGYMVTSMMYLMQSFAAETERNLILQRTAEGRKIAMENGVVFGRPPFEASDKFWEMKDGILDGTISNNRAKKELGINHRTLKKWIRIARKQKIGAALDAKISELMDTVEAWPSKPACMDA